MTSLLCTYSQMLYRLHFQSKYFGYLYYQVNSKCMSNNICYVRSNLHSREIHLCHALFSKFTIASRTKRSFETY